MVNVALKTAILTSPYGNQRRLAEFAKMREPRLSNIVHQQVDPTDDEKRTLASLLNKPIAELFPDPSMAPSTSTVQ